MLAVLVTKAQIYFRYDASELSQHISECYDRAADCKRRAEQTDDFDRKTELLNFQRTWTHLAHSYEFVESHERSLLSARNYSNREPGPSTPTQRAAAQISEAIGVRQR